MSNKSNGAIALLLLVLGCLMLIFDKPAINRAVLIICGAAFFIPGLLSVLGAFFTGHRKASAIRREAKAAADGDKKKEAEAKEKARTLPSDFMHIISLICGFGGIGLGVCIWVLPEIFQPITVWLFGILLILAGVYQLALLASRNRPVGFPAWFIIGPLLTLAGGIALTFVDFFHNYGEGYERNEYWMILITGIGLTIYGITGLCMAYMTWHHNRSEARNAKAETEAADKQAADKPAADKQVGKVDPKLASALKLTDDSETGAK